MKATVREYREVRKIVTLELGMDEVERILKYGCGTLFTEVLQRTLEDALGADRASDAQGEEDVPF